MLIRREREGDIPAIRAVTVTAFARPETASRIAPEATLVDELRAGEEWLPALSLVATDDGEITGHVLCTRGHVGAVPVLGLGPLSVRPDRQRQGVGTSLMHAVLGAADALGEPLVALLGRPGYYGRFAFRPSTEYQITPPDPDWGAYFQVRALACYDPAVRGAFRYAEPFDRV
ncbi:MAG: GNAT family N-acetyltransferase [Trebonia sp.]